MHQNLVLDSFFILVNNPKQPLHARNSFKNKVFERGLSKTLKKLTIFLLNPFLFNGQSYQIQKGPRTSDQLLFRLQTKLTKISLLVMYYPTKFINIKWFLSYSKNYTWKFMQANS